MHYGTTSCTNCLTIIKKSLSELTLLVEQLGSHGDWRRNPPVERLASFFKLLDQRDIILLGGCVPFNVL